VLQLPENTVYDFGLRLQKLRKNRGMTQAELADRLGVSKGTIYRYERNLQDPSLQTAIRLAVLLRTSLDYLTGIDDAYTIRIPSLTNTERQTLQLFLDTFMKR
jgi:transcriptional regulator with XRE-family HTH domain